MVDRAHGVNDPHTIVAYKGTGSPGNTDRNNTGKMEKFLEVGQSNGIYRTQKERWNY
jgi:hypothetical protein